MQISLDIFQLLRKKYAIGLIRHGWRIESSLNTINFYYDRPIHLYIYINGASQWISNNSYIFHAVNKRLPRKQVNVSVGDGD